MESGACKPMLHCVFGKVHIAQNVSPSVGKFYRFFKPPKSVQYYPLCDDFGPMNMSSVLRFVQAIGDEIEAHPTQKIIYVVDHGRRSLTNGVFLLGSFMVLKMKMTASEISNCFSWLNEEISEPFRDATFAPPDFGLSLLDCWRGLEKAMSYNWVADKGAIESTQPPDTTVRQVDLLEYEHYDDPLNGDLHEVVPGKFVAFKGPKDLDGKEFHDDHRGYRHFSPLYYVDIFHELGVTDVVRLNEPEYDANDFIDNGIAHHDLEFEDCTSPPNHIVAAFLRIVDSAPGLVAVHCKAGLGRTGTLIARHLMRSHGFSAREAMGWLRIMRPGSVIGEQQHYLCAVDGAAPAAPALAGLLRTPHAPHTPSPGRQALRGPATAAESPSHSPGSSSRLADRQNGQAAMPTSPPQQSSRGSRASQPTAAVLAAQVAAGMERRGAARTIPSAANVARLPSVTLTVAGRTAANVHVAAAPSGSVAAPVERSGRGPVLPGVRGLGGPLQPVRLR